jgi:hypothetical protein
MVTPASRASSAKRWNGKARVANLDHVVELLSIELARQQIEELAEIVLVETLEGCELPKESAQACRRAPPAQT